MVPCMFASDANASKRMERGSALLLLFVFLVIATHLELKTHGDDAWFQHVLDERSLGQFLVSRYNEWSGRILLEALLAGTIRYGMVWKLGIPACFIGSAWCIWRLALSRQMLPMSGTLLVTLLMLCIDHAVLIDGGWWVTGFYNYLLPVTMGLFAFTVLLHGARGRLATMAGVLAAILCCQHEQSAVALLAAMMGLLLVRAGSGIGMRREAVFLAAGLASAAVLFAAPGNVQRVQATLRLFPEYRDLGLIEKLGTGLDCLNAHLHSPDNLSIVIVAALSLLATWKSPNRHWAKLPLCGALAVFIVNMLLMRAGLHDYPNYPGMSAHLGPANWSRSGIYVSFFLTICFYGVLLASALYRSTTWKAALVDVGVPLLSVALVMAVSLSPTIYMSGERILYIPNLLLVLHACLMLRDRPLVGGVVRSSVSP